MQDKTRRPSKARQHDLILLSTSFEILSQLISPQRVWPRVFMVNTQNTHKSQSDSQVLTTSQRGELVPCTNVLAFGSRNLIWYRLCLGGNLIVLIYFQSKISVSDSDLEPKKQSKRVYILMHILKVVNSDYTHLRLNGKGLKAYI